MIKKIFLILFVFNLLFSGSITFQVDMQNQSMDNGAYIVGTWDYVFYQMSPVGDSGTYTYTHYFSSAGDTKQYWFATDSEWSSTEIVAREVTIPISDLTLPLVCFNSFDECPDNVEFPIILTFIDENQNWDNIWFITSQNDFNTPYQGINNNGTWTFEANFSPSSYEWGAFQASDDVGTQEIWITPNNPNLFFTISNDGSISGEVSYTLETYPVTFTVNDQTETFQNLFIRLGSSDFAYPNWGVENSCDDADGNNIWNCEVLLEPSQSIYWKVFDEGGTDINGLIGLGNIIFSLENNGSYNSELTSLVIPDLGEWVTNTIIFSVDMTEWLDESSSTGMPIFSVARDDEVQVRGDWNGWSDGAPNLSNLIRQPGTNIFSLPVELSGFSEASYSYKFYIKHSQTSIDLLELIYGNMEDLDWGWEDSPIYGGGNRQFNLSTPNGSTETIEEGYYDLPPGGVIPYPQSINLTYSVNMENQDDYSSGNEVNLVLRDKWTNFLQYFTISGVEDNNPVARFSADCNNSLCHANVGLVGPFPWHTLYTWEYKNNNGELISEGGQYGDYGKYRARYILDNNGSWQDYSFPTDIFQEDLPYNPETQPDPPDCTALGDINGDGGFNVLDIVGLANCVLANNCSDLGNGCAGDMNSDGGYNVLDIVALANCVLANNCAGRVNDATASSLSITDKLVSIEADGFIGGVQMTINHGDDFTIDMTDRALFADYLTTDNQTRLLVINPETEDLFTYNGQFEIIEIMVANTQYEVSVELPLASSFSLSEAYPNPFNPTTAMTLTMPIAGDVNVEVYNVRGQVVATLASGYMDANTYTLSWDATDASSGLYFVKATAEGFTKTQKLMLLK